MNRGDRREAIFHDEEDRRRFLCTLDEVCKKSGLASPCLLPDAEPFSPSRGDAS